MKSSGEPGPRQVAFPCGCKPGGMICNSPSLPGCELFALDAVWRKMPAATSRLEMVGIHGGRGRLFVVASPCPSPPSPRPETRVRLGQLYKSSEAEKRGLRNRYCGVQIICKRGGKPRVKPRVPNAEKQRQTRSEKVCISGDMARWISSQCGVEDIDTRRWRRRAWGSSTGQRDSPFGSKPGLDDRRQPGRSGNERRAACDCFSSDARVCLVNFSRLSRRHLQAGCPFRVILRWPAQERGPRVTRVRPNLRKQPWERGKLIRLQGLVTCPPETAGSFVDTYAVVLSVELLSSQLNPGHQR